MATPKTAGTKGLNDLIVILGSEAAATEFENDVLNAVSEEMLPSDLWKEVSAVRNSEKSIELHLYWDWLCEQAEQMQREAE